MNPSGTGLIPDAILWKKDYSQAGVSERYAYNPDIMWYVFRATYGHELADLPKCHLKRGDKIRATDGTFIGVEGRVVRVVG